MFDRQYALLIDSVGPGRPTRVRTSPNVNDAWVMEVCINVDFEDSWFIVATGNVFEMCHLDARYRDEPVEVDDEVLDFLNNHGEGEDEEYDEGSFCPSCDGSISPTAVSCGCGAMLVEMADPCEGMSFEERMAFEVTLENEERAMYGAPLIPIIGG